jgi:hypothetical protein
MRMHHPGSSGLASSCLSHPSESSLEQQQQQQARVTSLPASIVPSRVHMWSSCLCVHALDRARTRSCTHSIVHALDRARNSIACCARKTCATLIRKTHAPAPRHCSRVERRPLRVCRPVQWSPVGELSERTPEQTGVAPMGRPAPAPAPRHYRSRMDHRPLLEPCGGACFVTCTRACVRHPPARAPPTAAPEHLAHVVAAAHWCGHAPRWRELRAAQRALAVIGWSLSVSQ